MPNVFLKVVKKTNWDEPLFKTKRKIAIHIIIFFDFYEHKVIYFLRANKDYS